MDSQYFRGTFTDGKNYDYDFARLARKQEKLTFDVRYLSPQYIPPYDHTPFLELTLARPEQIINPEFAYLLNELKPILDQDIVVTQIKSALLKFFKDTLNEREEYLIFHSSGYDSRIISLTLAEIRDERGSMDNVHFRCHQPEGPMFLEIMKRENWKPSQYSIYEGPKEDYYNIGLRENYLNGWQNYNQQLNFWSDLGTDIILITGAGGELFKFLASLPWKPPSTDYANDFMWRRGHRTQNKNLDLLLNRFPFEGEWEGNWKKTFKDLILPYFSYEYLNVSLRTYPGICKNLEETDNIRKAVTEHYRYDLTNIQYHDHNYSWNISQKRKDLMKESYLTSKFYQDYQVGINFELLEKMRSWDCFVWGFMTVYEKIFV